MCRKTAMARLLVLLTLTGSATLLSNERRAHAADCVPGAQVACACPGGVQGVQICKPDQTFEPCVCPTPAAAEPPPPAATSTAAPPETAPPPETTAAPQPGPTAPPPQEFRTEKKTILALVITGAVTFGVIYLGGIAVAAAGFDEKESETAVPYAAIPLAGPWVILGSDLDTGEFGIPIAGLGILQAASVGVFIMGLTLGPEEQVPVAGAAKPQGPTLTLGLSTVGHSGTGLVGSGTF